MRQTFEAERKVSLRRDNAKAERGRRGANACKEAGCLTRVSSRALCGLTKPQSKEPSAYLTHVLGKSCYNFILILFYKS